MKRLFLGLVLTLGLGSGVRAQPLVLDSISLDQVPLRSGAGRSDEGVVQSQGAVPGSRGFSFQTVGPGLSVNRGGKKYRIRILEVRPLTGNNPLDPVEPLLNYDGRRVNSIVELVQLVDTGLGGGGNFSPCARSTPMHIVFSPGGPAPARSSIIYGANWNLDAQTLECTSAPPGVQGQGNFSVTWLTPMGGGAPTIDYFCGSPPPGDPQDWQFDDGGVLKNSGVNSPANVVKTLIAVSKSGARLEIQVRVDDPGVGAPVLNVLSIRRLN